MDTKQLRSRHSAGIKAVSIDQIHGSEGRSSDFDRHFNPAHENTRDRWVSVVSARLLGITLPAVELIQVGNQYFVRDGHHRISVAKSLGESAIDARVTVWEVVENTDR